MKNSLIKELFLW